MKNFLLELCLVGIFTTSATVLAQSEPVDKSFGGPYLGGVFGVGQASPSSDSSPGPAWLLGVDAGVVVKRDTWNRLEFGLEIDRGTLSYEDKEKAVDVDLDLDLMALVKAGYGYSLGDHAFGVFRLGVGVAQVSYRDDSDTSLAYLLGWDAVFPTSEQVEMSAGFSWRAINAKFSELGGSQFQVNLPSLTLGARVRL